MKRHIDLSSGFGDFRENRFHAGIDLRTGGEIGERVFSPVNGYVWRIKMSYRGYGKGLYVRGDDGYLYVFGHLSEFAERIDSCVKAAQLQEHRYYVDLYFPDDSLLVQAGELIAYSGETGTGAPHLHFEKRTADNLPINPLLHGYEIDDKTRPVFRRVGFELTDDTSVFLDGNRKLYYPVREKKPGLYVLDSVPYLNRPFGILADCFDQMRAGGMRQSVRKLTLMVDNSIRYELLYDTLDYAVGRTVNLNYDYREAVEDRKHVSCLYLKTGNSFPWARPAGPHNGICGLDPRMEMGTHRVTVLAEDCCGNKSELRFRFLWGPPGNVYLRDSTVVAGDSACFFYLSPVERYELLDIEDLMVQLNLGSKWGEPEDVTLKKLDDGRIEVWAGSARARYAVLRLVMVTESGGVIIDNPFPENANLPTKYPEISYEIVEDGLLVTVRSLNVKSSSPLVRLFRDDELIAAILPSRMINMQHYVYFIPPDPKYVRIDWMDVSATRERLLNPKMALSVGIFLAGIEDKESFTVDSLFTVSIGKESVYEPKFIAVEKEEILARIQMRVNSDSYRIRPEAFVTQTDFGISYLLDTVSVRPEQTGLCWLDEEKNRWVWLEDNSKEGWLLTAGSQGGGGFAAVIDNRAPDIGDLTITDGWTYRTPRPLVRFSLRDLLSGIEDDRSISLFIDDQWLIPEYDPESGICTSRPLEPLTSGEHVLQIAVTDRAGNTTERNIRFFVRI
jgi:hypothetical protein